MPNTVPHSKGVEGTWMCFPLSLLQGSGISLDSELLAFLLFAFCFYLFILFLRQGLTI